MPQAKKMSMQEIKDWIVFNMNVRAQNWTDETTKDQAVYEGYAKRSLPHSDINASREIYATFKHKVHYIPGSSAWHIWNGVYHEKIDGDLLAKWMCNAFLDAHRTALAKVKTRYELYAATLSGDAAKKKVAAYSKLDFLEHRQYRDKIHGHSGVTGLTSQIKDVFSVVDSFFVDDTNWLVLENGVLDLEDLRKRPPAPGDLKTLHSRLLPHDPARPVYRCVNASLHPNAQANRWRGFLETSIPDADLRKFLAVLCGAALLAENKTKTIPVLTGGKDSGKTVFIDNIHRLSGGYGGQPSKTALNVVQGQNFEQDQFRGLRFVGVSEPNTDRKVDESFLKQFTGGDVISTRNLHARSVEWKSQGVLFIATNNEMRFNTNDKAILERFATVDFPNRFYPLGQVPKGKEAFIHDRALEGDLLKEMDGILNWVLNGMLVYITEGLVIPEAVKTDRKRQYIEGSSVHLWVTDYVEAGQSSFIIDHEDDPERKPHEYVALAEAHLDYCSWCSIELGEEPMSLKMFSRQLRAYLDVELVKSSNMRVPRLVYRETVEYEALRS